MKPVRDIISREIIDDLWGAGYTILPATSRESFSRALSYEQMWGVFLSLRDFADIWTIVRNLRDADFTIVHRARHPDPFNVPSEIVPQDKSYQWMHLVHDQAWYRSRWTLVPASRHDGYFMPAGFVGDIEVNGLGLFEKPKFEVEQARTAQVASAHKMVDDWKEKWGGQFSGEFTVGVQTDAGYVSETVRLDGSKTIETITAVPREMVPYIDLIFKERDRLGKDFSEDGKETKWAVAPFEAHMKNYPDAPKWPTLNGILLPTAIDNVRKRIIEEAANASQAS